MNWFWKRIVIQALNWVIDNAEIRMYASRNQVGRLFRANDIQNVTDAYWVLDIRAAGRILILGCWQLT